MSTKIGVIVGRFQVDNLTRGHNYLLDKVRGDFGNNNVVIFIGETKTQKELHMILSLLKQGKKWYLSPIQR